MQGNADGSHVWFDPVGIHVAGPDDPVDQSRPGQLPYRDSLPPRNFDRPLRIPEAAEPWNSDYLLPNESFSVTLTAEGVYDFYCIPHEHAGMVGRIVVGRPRDEKPALSQAGSDPIPKSP